MHDVQTLVKNFKISKVNDILWLFSQNGCKFNFFRSVPNFLILLWLTPDNFTLQEETSPTGRG